MDKGGRAADNKEEDKKGAAKNRDGIVA